MTRPDPGPGEGVDRSVEHDIRRFVARVRVGTGLAGALEGLAGGGLALAAVLVVLRVLGVPLSPAWWWGLAPLGGALALAGLRLAALGFGPRDSAQHLDRRLALEGLLLTAVETDASAWRPRLDAGLAAAKAASPRPNLKTPLLHVAVAALSLLVVALLPPPGTTTRRPDPLGAEVLDALQERLETLAEADVLDDEQADEMRRRLGEMREGAEKDGVLSWSDVDALADRLEHERDLDAGRLAKAAEAVADLASRLGAEGADAPTAAEVKAALDAARDAGLLASLPEALRQQLGAGREGGEGQEGGGIPTDPETLAQLAAALAGAAGEALEGLEGAELLEGVDLEALDAKLAEAVGELGELVEGEPCTLCEEGDEDCPG